MVSNAFMEDEEVQALTDEKRCSECNSSEVAEIVWGYTVSNLVGFDIKFRFNTKK